VGAALQAAAAAAPPASADAAAQAAALGASLSARAPPLLADLRASVARDAVPTVTDRTRGEGGNTATVCHPYVAGTTECGMLTGVPSNRASEPWRTYAEAMYSGALGGGVCGEILAWHRTQQGAGVRGSRLKMGVLAGAGSDVSNGDELETFTLQGWGYGLLQADEVRAFLLGYFAIAAHGYTRGTFIAPESSVLDRSRRSASFATPAGLVAPLFLKWLLLWEDPATHALWIGKAVPRAWLAEGGGSGSGGEEDEEDEEDKEGQQGQGVVALDGGTSAYGRISFRLTSRVDSDRSIMANLTLPPYWGRSSSSESNATAAAPPGGLKLRLRHPTRARIVGVSVAGAAWTAFNAIEETVVISRDALAAVRSLKDFERIVVTY